VTRARGAAVAALGPLAAALLLMLALGVFHAWSLFVPDLEDRLDLSRAAVSSVYALAVGPFALGMLMAPALLRRMPPAACAAAAGLVAAAGLLVASTGAAWALWVGFAGLFGLANGVGYIVALQVIQVALPRRRGLATSLAVTAYAAGPALLIPLLELSIRRLGVFDTFALIAAGVALLGALQLALLRGFRLPAPEPHHERLPVYDRTFRVLWVSFFLAAAAGLATLAHAAGIVSSLGGGAATAALGAALIALGNAVGRLVGGSLTDLLEVRWVLLAAGAFGAGALVAGAGIGTAAAGLAAVAGAGLSYGAISSTYPAAVGHFYGTARLGRVYARLFTAWAAAGLTAPVAAGVVFDAAESYTIVLIVAALAALGSGAVALMLPSARGQE
jgi:OFA family oxalate/formate antiporter-like MFS transporter